MSPDIITSVPEEHASDHERKTVGYVKAWTNESVEHTFLLNLRGSDNFG